MPQILDASSPEAVEMTKTIAAAYHGKETGDVLASIACVLGGILLQLEDLQEREDAYTSFVLTLYDFFLKVAPSETEHHHQLAQLKRPDKLN